MQLQPKIKEIDYDLSLRLNVPNSKAKSNKVNKQKKNEKEGMRKKNWKYNIY